MRSRTVSKPGIRQNRFVQHLTFYCLQIYTEKQSLSLRLHHHFSNFQASTLHRKRLHQPIDKSRMPCDHTIVAGVARAHAFERQLRNLKRRFTGDPHAPLLHDTFFGQQRWFRRLQFELAPQPPISRFQLQPSFDRSIPDGTDWSQSADPCRERCAAAKVERKIINALRRTG